MNYTKLSTELLYLSNCYSRAGRSGIQNDMEVLGIVSERHSPKPSRVVIGEKLELAALLSMFPVVPHPGAMARTTGPTPHPREVWLH